MKTAYCLTGLGADERIFQNLDIPGITFMHIRWLQPLAQETLEEYARRIILQIPDPKPILVGVSFGGMMAIEIARIIPVEKITLISSVKSFKEIPRWMKACGRYKLDKMLPGRSLKEIRPLKILRPMQDYFLGTEGPEEKKLANEFRDQVNPVYLKWSLHQVFNWKNEWQPEGLFHIHGSADHIFPIKNIRATHVIKGGGHFMVMNRHREVSAALAAILHI